MGLVSWGIELVDSMFGARWIVVQKYPFKGRILSAIGADGRSAALHFRTEMDAIAMAKRLSDMEIC